MNISNENIGLGRNPDVSGKHSYFMPYQWTPWAWLFDDVPECKENCESWFPSSKDIQLREGCKTMCKDSDGKSPESKADYLLAIGAYVPAGSDNQNGKDQGKDGDPAFADKMKAVGTWALIIGVPLLMIILLAYTVRKLKR